MRLRFWKKPSGALPGVPPIAVREEQAPEPPVPDEVSPGSGTAVTPPVPEPAAAPAPVATVTCPACGADVEADSKFCTQCAAPLTEEAEAVIAAVPAPAPAGKKRKLSRRRRIEGQVEPWAVRAGDSVSRVPRSVKIGIPVAILVIIAIVVTLFTLSATHSPQAAISRYMGELKVGDYKEAYSLIAHPGGRFSTYEYFSKWQNTTTDNIGRLQDFNIQERKTENKFFGKLIEPPPTVGTPFVVTMKYKDQSFDVNMTVEDAGGSWPLKKWRLKLTEGTSRMVVSPLGSQIFIDGMPAGAAVPEKDLADALQLKHFPKDIDGAVDYARKLVKTFQFLVSEFRRLATNLEGVTESAQRVVDRFGTGGFTWSDLLDAADTTAQQSKEFGQDVARLAIHIYWIFGGGDDGSVRANLSRVQSGLDVKNLPEGWHQVSAKLPGAVPDSKDFIAPQGVELNLDPTPATERSLKITMNGYYKAVTTAMSTLKTAVLKPSLAGAALVEETNKVLSLSGKGQSVVAQLTDLKFVNFKLLNERIATVETSETWNYTTYQDGNAVSSILGQKIKMVYTLEEQGGGLWKVIERKQI
ncbi:MAG: zinc-ribbon domain-containing protein [Candidatus Geothermincolia bacterium]